MKTVAIAIEGVLAREPIGEFAAAVINPNGLWLVSVLAENTSAILVTGSSDQAGVQHFLRTNGVNVGVEYPNPAREGAALWYNRLVALEQLNYQYRGNLVVVDTFDAIRTAMVARGAMVLAPWFPRRGNDVDEDEHVPLRSVRRFWSND